MPHLEGVEHRFADAGGLRTHYVEAGDPAADTVLLVHGWPECWWAWRHLIGPLAERFHVIAPDLRGLGWSAAPPGGYEKWNLARDVVALMDELRIERASWVGHDWGGFAGWHAMTEHGERFERFMPLSIPPPWPAAPTRSCAAWATSTRTTPTTWRSRTSTAPPTGCRRRRRARCSTTLSSSSPDGPRLARAVRDRRGRRRRGARAGAGEAPRD